jgi:hypothetical protein
MYISRVRENVPNWSGLGNTNTTTRTFAKKLFNGKYLLILVMELQKIYARIYNDMVSVQQKFEKYPT